MPHRALDGTAMEVESPYCPGVDVSSLVVERAWELRAARMAGYDLGPHRSALAPEADLLIELEAAITAAREMDVRQNS